jgi:ribosome-binding protein aMBF1 (putative translation factor)
MDAEPKESDDAKCNFCGNKAGTHKFQVDNGYFRVCNSCGNAIDFINEEDEDGR